ncbi:sugar ABC transporter substrate-binding protein [Oceanirhabdus sp. W0125-5]|uniref:sugar ABC transporter substrate-binding protein n=1 Tax=Oceanirhabdus sp. W0125-5 TaxID=2999116 RepID=UPI0022F30BE5|nr:maltose ABC transporter substrate-binding protein [Oceanirhabdus sp. W0125-5]WBW95512.1 maltose ABC transporter substrate-binding protein [Oceanirhabdus sp. W0125-5]
MNKHFKVFMSILTVIALSLAFVGCGNKGNNKNESNNQSKSNEKKSVELTVWSHLTEEEVVDLDKVAQAWAEETGNKVKVIHDKGDFQAYLQAANSSKGPDIMFGLAHDNLGTFNQAKLLAEVPEGVITDDIQQSALDAVMFDNKAYALPIGMESIALFYNKDLVDAVPETIEELIKVGQEKGFMFDANNLYFNFPIIAGNGGYVFGKDDHGNLTAGDLGLGEAATPGYEMLQDFVGKYGLMPKDITGDIAKGKFTNGEIAFYVSGSWDVAGFEEAGLNFGISKMPQIKGKVAPTFLGVQVAFVSPKSDKQDAAWDFAKYVSEKSFFNRLPVRKSHLEDIKDNEILSGFAEQATYGIPMPNIPEMQSVWPMNDSFGMLTRGEMSPEDFAKQVESDIKEAIELQNAE